MKVKYACYPQLIYKDWERDYLPTPKDEIYIDGKIYKEAERTYNYEKDELTMRLFKPSY